MFIKFNIFAKISYIIKLLKNIKINLFKFTFFKNTFKYPVPGSINYFWSFGSISLIALIGQIITGVILAMHYSPDINYAFISVEHIMRDVTGGWLIRFLHSNGASLFFFFVYLHMLRGIFYGSFGKPRHYVWIVGVIIFFLMVATAFFGYVLPWGQMSFWAATVITNLATTVPFAGKKIVHWLWGGYSVDYATLTRFYSLHYLLPFVILGLSILHILILHKFKSSVPEGLVRWSTYVDKMPLHPYFTIKDFFGFCIYGIFFMLIVAFIPNHFGHPDNYLPANPLVTPPHIVPEWYFLLFYAILRSVPSKTGGVFLLFMAIFILFLVPYLYNTVGYNCGQHSPIYTRYFWSFVYVCILLSWTGGKPVESPFIELASFCVIYFFAFFFVIIPIFSISFNIPYFDVMVDYGYKRNK